MMTLREWGHDVHALTPDEIVRRAAEMKSRDGQSWFSVVVEGLAGRIGILQCRPTGGAMRIVTADNREIHLFPWFVKPIASGPSPKYWMCEASFALRLLLGEPLACFIAENDALSRVVAKFPAEAMIVTAELQQVVSA